MTNDVKITESLGLLHKHGIALWKRMVNNYQRIRK